MIVLVPAPIAQLVAAGKWTEILMLARWTLPSSPTLRPFMNWPTAEWMRRVKRTFVENAYCSIDSASLRDVRLLLEGRVRRVFLQGGMGEQDLRDLDAAVILLRGVGQTLLPSGERMNDILETRYSGLLSIMGERQFGLCGGCLRLDPAGPHRPPCTQGYRPCGHIGSLPALCLPRGLPTPRPLAILCAIHLIAEK